MKENVVSYKCPSCGGALRFDAESSMFVCDYCDSRFDLETVQNAEINSGEERYDWGNYKEKIGKEKVEGTVSWICTNCGAEIVTDAATAATKCPYCDNVVVVAPNVTGTIKPNAIIPFAVDKKRLQELLKNYFKGKMFLPKDFVTLNKIKEIQGIYVPFWLFDCHADGNMTFEATRTRHWSDSNYNYTATSFYYIPCDGEMNFAKIPVDGSVKMDDALMDSIEPFDYNGLVPFDAAYFSGFLADRFDSDADENLPRADRRVRESVSDVFRTQIIGFQTVRPLTSNIQLSDTDVKYVLLPVYTMKCKYKGEEYLFGVNGQTGKVVGNLPVSKGKFAAWLGGITAGVGAILSLLAYFLG